MKGQESKELYDVFISYRRKGGSEKAQLVKSELKQRGINEERIFLDTHSLHEGDFAQKIHDAIRLSKNVVVIISKGCFEEVRDTDYWYLEIREALNQSKNVVPIFFDNISSFSNLHVPNDLHSLKTQNSITYQHEYATAAFDKLHTFLGLKGYETSVGAQRRGCLLKYRSCMFSIVVVFLGLIIITPIILNSSSDSQKYMAQNSEDKELKNDSEKDVLSRDNNDPLNINSNNHQKKLASADSDEKFESSVSASANCGTSASPQKETLLDWALYSGEYKLGKPHGIGILKITKPFRLNTISLSPGDKIKGSFRDGNIYVAKLYKTDGTTITLKDVQLSYK